MLNRERVTSDGGLAFVVGKPAWNSGKKMTPKHHANFMDGSADSFQKERDKNPKPWHQKEFLVREYLENKKTPRQIASEFGGCNDDICYWLKKHGITRRTKSEAFKLRTPKYGSNHPGWMGDDYKFTRSDGYVMVRCGKNKMGQSAFRLEHIVIAEKELGRKLRKGEVVHHVNGNNSDNRNCNLLVCTQSYHSSLHHKMSQLYMEEHFAGA